MNTTQTYLVFAYLIYITLLGLFMFRQRWVAISSRRIKGKYFKDYQGEIPMDLKVMENHFKNQFEVPIVFMITSLYAIEFNAVTKLFFIFSCLFVFTRVFHSYFHLVNHIVLYRAASFFTGMFILLGMWVLLLMEL